MAFSVVEPHPSVPRAKKTNLSTGRGGAGNFSTHDSSSLTSGPSATGPAFRKSQHAGVITAKQTSTPSQPRPSLPANKSDATAPKAISGGIGGAGNFRPASDRRMFSFDEELERAQRLESARNGVPVYHFGRGGAGNLASSVTDKASLRASERGNSRAGSAASTATGSSVESRASRRGLGSWIRGLSTSRE